MWTWATLGVLVVTATLSIKLFWFFFDHLRKDSSLGPEVAGAPCEAATK